MSGSPILGSITVYFNNSPGMIASTYPFTGMISFPSCCIFQRTGLPFFQSESTAQLNMYCFVQAGSVSAAQTLLLGALIRMLLSTFISFVICLDLWNKITGRQRRSIAQHG